MFRPRRSSLVVTALTSLSMAAPLVLAAPALAAPAQHVSQCTGQDKVLIKRVEGISQHFVATNYTKVRIPSGVNYSQSTKMAYATTLTASTNITKEIGGSASWGFASISGSIKSAVAKEKSTTGSKTASHTFGVPKENHTRSYVFYEGWTQVKGRWHYLECSRAPGVGNNKFGPIQTYRAQSFGALLCPRTRYKKNGTLYSIAVQGGC